MDLTPIPDPLEPIVWTDPHTKIAYLVDPRTGYSYLRDGRNLDIGHESLSCPAENNSGRRTLVDRRWLQSSIVEDRDHGGSGRAGDTPDGIIKALKVSPESPVDIFRRLTAMGPCATRYHILTKFVDYRRTTSTLRPNQASSAHHTSCLPPLTRLLHPLQPFTHPATPLQTKCTTTNAAASSHPAHLHAVQTFLSRTTRTKRIASAEKTSKTGNNRTGGSQVCRLLY